MVPRYRKPPQGLSSAEPPTLLLAPTLPTRAAYLAL